MGLNCIKCKSTNLSANKKGFGFGKAAVGGLVAGPLGLLAGGIGSKKVIVTCLDCGKTMEHKALIQRQKMKDDIDKSFKVWEDLFKDLSKKK